MQDEDAAQYLTCPPGQSNVGRSQRIVANPAALFELQGRSRVDIGDEGAKCCKAEQGGELMPCPPV